MSTSLATRKHSNHARVERVLVEAIEAVVTPNIAAKLLTGALRAALLSAVPTDRAELTRFVKGQLFDSLAGMLGDDEAGIVVEGLMPILPRVSDPSEHSQIRATTRPARSDEFTRPEVGEPLGVAIIASAHPTRRSGLLHDLGSDCVALHADDLMALFDQVHASAFAHPVLVLDCLSGQGPSSRSLHT